MQIQAAGGCLHEFAWAIIIKGYINRALSLWLNRSTAQHWHCSVPNRLLAGAFCTG